MITINVTYEGPIGELKEQQLARTIERAVKYPAEHEFTEYVTHVVADVHKETK